jgi:MFS family permease
VIGTLIVYFFDKLALNWQFQVAVMIIPALIYGHMFYRRQFPVTERVASGVSSKEMYRSLLNPLFIFMIICMFGTAITELFTAQWIQVLLNNVTQNAILVLTVTTGVMVIGRAFAGPVVHKLSPPGVLLASAILSALGLYMLGNTDGNLLFAGAIVFGTGVCYFWPTMLGFVAEYLPKTGAVGINLMGGAGMFAVSLYMMFMGGVYDRKIAKHLAPGVDAAEANRAAGPEIINATLFIPIALIIAFTGLLIYMKVVFKRKT